MLLYPIFLINYFAEEWIFNVETELHDYTREGCFVYRQNSHALSAIGKRKHITYKNQLVVGIQMNIKASGIINAISQIVSNRDDYATKTMAQPQLK
jgi:hypothetical protein